MAIVSRHVAARYVRGRGECETRKVTGSTHLLRCVEILVMLRRHQKSQYSWRKKSLPRVSSDPSGVVRKFVIANMWNPKIPRRAEALLTQTGDSSDTGWIAADAYARVALLVQKVLCRSRAVPLAEASASSPAR